MESGVQEVCQFTAINCFGFGFRSAIVVINVRQTFCFGVCGAGLKLYVRVSVSLRAARPPRILTLRVINVQGTIGLCNGRVLAKFRLFHSIRPNEDLYVFVRTSRYSIRMMRYYAFNSINARRCLFSVPINEGIGVATVNAYQIPFFQCVQEIKFIPVKNVTQ